MIRVNDRWSNGETEVEIHDPEPDDHRIFRVHPWHRGTDSSVYVSVGTYSGEDGGGVEGVEDNEWNMIVNRDDFVEAILAVLPELKRA